MSAKKETKCVGSKKRRINKYSSSEKTKNGYGCMKILAFWSFVELKTVYFFFFASLFCSDKRKSGEKEKVLNIFAVISPPSHLECKAMNFVGRQHEWSLDSKTAFETYLYLQLCFFQNDTMKKSKFYSLTHKNIFDLLWLLPTHAHIIFSRT